MPTDIPHWMRKNKPFWHQQFYNQIRRNTSCHCWRQQREQLEATFQSDNHQHTAHNHKEALKDSTEHFSNKWEHSQHIWRTTTSSTSSASKNQSCHGWFDTLPIYSIGMQSTMMAKLPTSGGGTKNKTPLCEFGETIQYMISHHKRMPKLESRFCKGIWLSGTQWQ